MTQFRNERLAFNVRRGTVPAQREIDAALAADANPTFATSAYAEPRDWGYAGLLTFTAVPPLRPQDHFPGLAPLHIAQATALAGIAPIMLHRPAPPHAVPRIAREP